LSSFDVLRAYLEARAAFSDGDIAFLRERFTPATIAAGDFVQRGGEPARRAVFVAAGCLRSYVIDDDGKEHVVQFAPETWWLADAISLASGAPSQYFFDAIEDSEVLLIDAPSHRELVDHVPGYTAAMRDGLQRHAAAKDQRIVTSLTATAEQRYVEFVERYPSLIQRVPQWMVASYLGVSPETVSRVRKKLSRR
jgi:CRP-like cAMP-binding protein